ncbi:phosphatase, PAP2 family [Gottschalkia acidurici 9a]|uniref:Phosphatase, PAP2 family n=1 Tax=Gottschalkia acidurici (strain ATCC 7906 / DSM 604 / BCRC 14475 / CIP 104303 / KCTC 5404 / NCIMB 10678 / 9a) TaxID=1128398 RepID=K0AWU5_GOTA9|nr:phosphatase PAP2 family protein [Gottschalkia acidurici]AFS77709.1 phosphatase, PAP2 family [Gottschalkia acidurici 9a]
MKRLVEYFTFKDLSMFYFLNTRLNCKLLNRIMPYVTELGGVVFSTIFPIVLIVLNKRQSRTIGFEILFSLGLGQVIVHILKKSLTRERPYNILKNINTFGIELKDYSFPSGHTTAGFTTAVHLSMYIPQFMLVFVAMAVMVGISRIYLAVHYPSDVAVGLVIGISASLVSHSYLVSYL